MQLVVLLLIKAENYLFSSAIDFAGQEGLVEVETEY